MIFISFFLIFLQGLEHLMYNLGLGQLEFEPSHTVDEHKPKNRNANNIANEEAIIKTLMDQQTKKLMSEDEYMPISPDTKGNSQTTDTNNHDHSHTDNDKDDDQKLTLDNTVIVEFKEMHDPKHRHPRENGK